MITTIAIIWATGFFVMGTDRVCESIQHPPQRVISLGEEIATDVVMSAAWPITLGFQVKQAAESGR